MDELVKLETAILAKEKGFNDNCDYFFHDSRNAKPRKIHPYTNNKEIDEMKIEDKYSTLLCTCPTQTHLHRWLREEYNLDVNVITKHKDLGKFYGGFVDTNDDRTNYSYGSNFREYEKAMEAGLLAALKKLN